MESKAAVDGEPIESELLKQIQEILCSSDILSSNDSKKGIGIYNVNNRIKSTYDNNYGLQILSVQKGTTIIYQLNYSAIF